MLKTKYGKIDWYPAANETGVVGRFEYYDQLDVNASKLADEEKFRQIIVCRMKVVSDVDESIVPLRDFNKQALIKRFPTAWAAFNGEEVQLDGTALSEIGIGETKVLDYRINAITTVEQLALLTDAQCEQVGFGTRKQRADAQAFLAKKQADTMAKVMASVEEPKKNKGGRPTNAARAAKAAAEAA